MVKSITAIGDVTDTAAWVATYRARETARPNPLFKDPLAKLLSGATGEKIAAENHIFGAEWYIVMRTFIIDNLIQKAIAEGVDTIINLGAGLDTRPYRLELPKDLLWIEVDFAKSVDSKNTILKDQISQCRLERIACDLSLPDQRAELLQSLNNRVQRALIITEGLLPYLTPEQVADLGRDLKAQKNFMFWIIDFFAAFMIKVVSRGKQKTEMQNAPFLFGPKEWRKFFKDLGWQPAAVCYVASESKRIGRPLPYPSIVNSLFKMLPSPLRRRLEALSGFAMLINQD